MGNLFSVPSRIRSTLSGQDGIALLMVLVVITILTTLVVSFIDTTQKHLQVTQYYKNRLQAYWAAQSGLQAAVALLRMNVQLSGQAGLGTSDGATSPWSCESEAYQQVVPLLLANIFCESSMIEPALLLNDPSGSGTDMSLSRCPSAVPILDENRKLSLYRLIAGIGTAQERTDEATLKRVTYLLQYLLKEADFATEEQEQETGLTLGLEEETRISVDQAGILAGYLVDWMDTENNKNAEHNPDTAEQSCPADGLPYEAKNGMLDSIDEIGLVCGFRQLPHTTIERLTRHLTAYDLDTNINTATHPVLHAFCAPPPNGDGENETDSEEIFQLLHFDADDESIRIIESTGDYMDILGTQISNTQLINHLKDSTAFASTHFRVGIYGLVYNTENGTVLARAKLQMDLRKGTGSNFDVLYYRED